MPDQAVTKKWLLLSLVLIFVLALAYVLLNKPNSSVTPPAKAPEAKAQKPLEQQAAQATKQPPPPPQPVALTANAEKLPEAITPEGVKIQIDENKPHILINADDPNQQNQVQGPIRAIYYTLSPSYRNAQTQVTKDRQINPNNPAPALRPDSQRLAGTPLEWKRLGLPIPPNSIPEQPLKITPKQLSEAIKDNVDLQIVDLRPVDPVGNTVSPFPNALRWLPHEALKNMPKLSKEKWTVLIGIGGEDAQPMAFELSQKGYVLMTILEGGYPAWVNATDR